MEHLEEVGCLVKRLSDRLRTSADANMKKRELTYSQCMVLSYLDAHEGRASQKQVEDALGVAHPTVVGLVSRLEKNGFVRCRMDDRDRRTKLISVTEKAEAVRAEVSAERREAEQRLTRGLSAKELAELSRMLHLLYHNLEEEKEV